MLSADHPELLANYRTAQGAHSAAGVEPLRQAFVHYRDVFERLVESPVTSLEPARAGERADDRDRDGVDDDHEDERPSRFSNAYGTVMRAAKAADPAGRRIARRRRDRESEPSDR